MTNAKTVQSSDEISEMSCFAIYSKNVGTRLFFLVTKSQMFADVKKLSFI